MAIYTGTWKNGDGVGFDPAAFSIKEIAAVTTSTVEVYGVTNPDCTGTYEYTATHNGLPYFTRDDDAFVLFWYQTDGHWTIAVDLTEPPVNYWASGLALEYFFGAHGTFAGGPHPFITPHPDFTVSGILTPDATGTYAHAGTFNNLPYWQHTTGPFFLYYSQGFWTWLISPALQDWPADGWFTASIHQSVYWAFGAYFGYTSPYYDPAPDITVHQTTDPVTQGTYIYQGLHNAYPYWTREDDAFSIWANPAIANWFLSVAPGDVAAGKWWTAIGLTATYTATAPYTGNPNLEQFITTTAAAYGVARLRVAGRRAGCGSAPGDYHGTPAQAQVRREFANRMKAYSQTEPEIEAWIEGNPLPDVTGWYRYYGEIGGWPALFSITTEFYIWWDQFEHWWVVSDNAPVPPGPADFWWKRDDPDPIGLYQPQGMSVNDLAVVEN